MDNMISRQMAIDSIQYAGKIGKQTCIAILKRLPSAQPYTIHSDGRLWVTVDDLDKVNAVVVDEHKSKFCKQFYMDAEPERKKGKWIPTTEIQEGQIGWRVYKCSNCSHYRRKPMNYCEVCGAKMVR